MSDKITRRLRIKGRVHGVGYRMSLLAMAEQLALKGWTRNRRDGSVEALVQGEAAAIEDLIAWARQGPPNARVDEVESLEAGADEQGPFAGFHIRADG